MIKSKEGMTNYCEGCHRFVLKRQLQDKERQIQEMQAEIDEQKEENSELKEENSELKRKLEGLIGEVEEE